MTVNKAALIFTRRGSLLTAVLLALLSIFGASDNRLPGTSGVASAQQAQVVLAWSSRGQ